MISIEFGFVAGPAQTPGNSLLVLRWLCKQCKVDDQGIDEDEGLDSVLAHLRIYHTREELRRFAKLLAKGFAAGAAEVHHDGDSPAYAEANGHFRVVSELAADYVTSPEWDDMPPYRKAVAG